MSAAAAKPVTTPAPTSVHAEERTVHHFTVDVEEYFQVSALEPYVARSRWDSIPTRVELGVRQLLELLAEHGAGGTFFVLGWIAERHPDLVREIAAAGHEIASHGWGHERVTQLTPAEFRESVRSSRQILEDVAGVAVTGYRAPSFSIVRGGEWALDVLLEEGYRYDSSLYPVRRPGYGFAGGERDQHALVREAGTLQEFPPATWQVAGAVLPAGGGAYFRLLPYGLVHSALRSAEGRQAAATFYIHPWELDPGQPRFSVKLATRIRHYGGLSRTVPRLRRMLRNFRFQPIARTLQSQVPRS
jgi:polysaccharide deacetylase family protein (PEP-CTERM system associated)